MRLAWLVLRRLGVLVIVMLGAATVVFVVLRLSGDPVALFAAPDTPAETLARIRNEMGFNDPLYAQYGRYIWSLARGDLGISLRYNRPVAELVLDRLPATLQLGLAGLALAVVGGVAAGVLAAVHRGGLFDQIGVAGALLGQSVPPFWLGLMLILLFAVQWHLLPTFGTGSPRHLVLPALTVAAFATARIARLTRAAFLEVLGEDYLRTARAKGLREAVVLLRHAAPNAAIPVLTVISLTLSALVGGSIVTETVFAWPGLGRLMVQGVTGRDYPLVQGAVLVVALLVAAITVVTDVLYVLIDPRIRVGRRES